MSTAFLTVTDLSITSDEKTLFEKISFEAHAGELIAIMGPSGIGKSMLTRAIAGFLPDTLSTQGSVAINGVEVNNTPMIQRKPSQRPAFIFQDALQALNPLVSVGGQLTLALTSSKTKPNKAQKQKIVSLLEQLGFTATEDTLGKLPSELSGGQRQRICIAIGLLSSANIMVADEPTSALDPITERDILKLIRQSVKDNQVAGLLITHDLHSALECDKLLLIDEGSMLAFGPPKDALAASTHQFCCSLRDLVA